MVRLLVAIVVFGGLVASPQPAQAQLFWWQRKCASCTSVPYTAARACGVAATCRYVPQTYYRTQYVRVPVVSYRPVTACDPCTGCPVTTLRPITTYACRPQLVPYTSYRLVYSAPACAPLAGATTAYYAAPSSCCGTAQRAAYAAPPPLPASSYVTNPAYSVPGNISLPPASELHSALPEVPADGSAQPSLKPTPDPAYSEGSSGESASGDASNSSGSGIPEASGPSAERQSGPALPDPDSRVTRRTMHHAIWRASSGASEGNSESSPSSRPAPRKPQSPWRPSSR